MPLADRRARLADARLYFVCGTTAGGRPIAEVLTPALAGGVDLFQLRDKQADDDALLACATSIRDICAEAGALFILNDRPDLAVAAGADGVHIGQDDMAPGEAREIVGDELLVGLSTHSPPQVDDAAAADYIGVGPVYATPTKRWRPAVGLELVEYAREAATQPWFAIGGIDATNISTVVGAGASRVAVVRAISDADDPELAARGLRGALAHQEVSHGTA